jgi:alpha-galactosidase
MKRLQPGDRFESVPVAVGRLEGGFDQAVAALTKYRRAMRRPSRDTDTLPIIFNDYMNCLTAEPTTQKLMPLIEAAAEVGCEYFVIDAGWYADGHWWDAVGEWMPSHARFPGGLKQVLDHIRNRGMTPGLWLEIEVMGIKCPLADQLPIDWFFHRNGKRAIDNGRYQLDFRHPDVQTHADKVVDRLVREYGVGYIKMDYNINAGPGTDMNADSLGAGLLDHNRAYLAWIDRIFERYPDLVIENCGSGGLRMDYAMLSRHSIQSSTDQTDLHKNAVVVASVLSAVAPEQSAVWSYPLADCSREDVIFNMINALLMRVHQSGKLSDLTPENRLIVKQALDYYRRFRHDIPRSVPFWPMGLPAFGDSAVSLGLRCEDKCYIAIWRLGGDSSRIDLSLPHLRGRRPTIKCTFPGPDTVTTQWNSNEAKLTVLLPQAGTARLLEVVDKDY